MALRTANDDIDDKLNPGRNPGDTAANQEFDRIRAAEEKGSFNQIVSPENYKQDGTSGDLSNSARQAEENIDKSGNWNVKMPAQTKNKKWFGKVSFLKKKGPLVGIIISLVAGFAGIGGLLSPSLLIIQMKENLTSMLSDSTPALSKRTTLMLARKVDGLKNAFAESGAGVCGIKCKFGTISNTMKLNLESPSNKFKATFEDKKFGGRWVIKTITFPDGSVARNGTDFSNLLKDPARASAFNKVFNSKTAYFLNSKFGSMLKTKFGLDKLAKWSGNTKEKVTASIRKSLGLPEIDPNAKLDAETRARSGKFKPVFEAIDKVGAKTSKITNVAGGACTIYDVGKGITIAEKAAKMAAFASFAFMFLNIADQIKSGDSPDPVAVSTAGDMLTQYDTNKTNADRSVNTDYGKSATDSVGYHMAAYNDTPGTLSAQDQKYSLSPAPGAASLLGGLTGYLVGAGAGAIAGAHTTCKIVNNPVIGTLASCSNEIIAAISTVVETAGIGALVAGAECVVRSGIMIGAMQITAGLLIGGIVSQIVNNDLPTVDETTKGSAAGNIIYSGTAQILGGGSAVYGMKAGSQADIKQYALDASLVNRQNQAIAKYDASKTPFDIQNQYSFVGSFVRNLSFSGSQNNTFASRVSSIVNILPKSLSLLSTSTNAASDISQANAKSNLYKNTCQDMGLKSIGVDADALCNPSYVMSSSELNADSNSTIDYMTANNYIDGNTGNAIAGSDYQKYLDNCANRVDPLGETSSSIEDDDYEWKVGLRCTENSDELSNFRIYTMDKSINDTMNYDEPVATAVITDANSTDKKTLTQKIVAKNTVAYLGDIQPRLGVALNTMFAGFLPVKKYEGMIL